MKESFFKKNPEFEKNQPTLGFTSILGQFQKLSHIVLNPRSFFLFSMRLLLALLLINVIVLCPSHGASKFNRRPQSLDLTVKAKNLLSDRKWHEVIDLLNKNTDKISSQGLLVLASAYGEISDLKNQVRVLSLLNRKTKNDARVTYILGDAQLKWSKLETNLSEKQDLETTAIQNLRLATKLKKTYRPPYLRLAHHFYDSQNNHEARELLIELLRYSPRDKDGHLFLCQLYVEDGFLSQASQNCNRAIQFAPRSPHGYIALAQTYFDQKKLEDAEKTLVQAANLFPNEPSMLTAAGKFFLSGQSYAVATRYFKKAYEIEPKNAQNTSLLALALFEDNLHQEALPYFELACAQDPKLQERFLVAAAKLRLSKNSSLGQKYTSLANGCRRR